MTKMNKKIAGMVAAGAVVLGMGLGGCSKFTEPFKDAPTAGHNNAPALIIEMPDGFSNVATKCVGDIRYTVTYHNDKPYGAVTTVVDPACK